MKKHVLIQIIMAEEFGDGSYDDGYEDAYDYWESERNWKKRLEYCQKMLELQIIYGCRITAPMGK